MSGKSSLPLKTKKSMMRTYIGGLADSDRICARDDMASLIDDHHIVGDACSHRIGLFLFHAPNHWSLDVLGIHANLLIGSAQPRISLRQAGSIFPSGSANSSEFPSLPKRLVSVVIFSAFFLSVLSLHFLGISFPIPNFLGSNPSDPLYVEPHLLHTDLGLDIAAISSNPPTIRATVTNYHPETTVSLLTWDTPLDDLAPSLGLFTFRETSVSSTPSLGFQRVEPERPGEPPDDAFYELSPFHAVTKDIVLSDARSIANAAGQSSLLPGVVNYEIEVKGNWRAFWHANVTKLGSERLKKMGGGFGYYQGTFRASCMMHVD